MPTLGGIFAKKKVSTYGTYFLMVLNWKDLSKKSVAAMKLSKKEKEAIEKHNIERIQKDMEKIDKDIQDAEKSGYKLAYRNLLLVRKSILILRHLARSSKENFRLMEKEVKQILEELGKDKELKKTFKKLLKEEMEVDAFVDERVRNVIQTAHNELQNEQRTVFATERIGVGKLGTKLTMKGNANSFTRRMYVRWGPLIRMKRAAKYEDVDANTLEQEMNKAKVMLMEILQKLKSLDRFHGKVKEHTKQLGKIGKEGLKTKREVEDLIKETKKLMDEAEQMIKSAYRVFIFTFILMRGIVQLEEDQIILDEQLMAKHEIPAIMGMKDIAVLKGDRKEIEEELRNIEKFLLQLWNL